MRFAFKTSPQNTTWADMLSVWRAVLEPLAEAIRDSELLN